MHHWHTSLVVVAVSALLVPGCTTGSETPWANVNDRCEEAIEIAQQAETDLQDAFAGPCVVDADCAIDGGHIACPDSPGLYTGEIAYSVARADEFHAARSVASEEICTLRCAGFVLDNFFTYAWCGDGICQGTRVSPDRRCGAIAESATSNLESFFTPASRACVSADECTLFATDLPCPEFGHVIVGCPVVLPIARADEVRDAIERIGERSCNDFGYTCDFHADCEPVVPDCVEGPR